MKSPTLLRALLFAAAVCVSIDAVAQNWLKTMPPPDVDKTYPTNPDNSCSLAASANMLAGAGYGTGTTIQARAESIYADLTGHFGTTSGQWPDTCLGWWLGSVHNTQKATNPYTVVTVHGGTACSVPLASPDLPRDVGNALRECRFVGYVIWWPSCDAAHNCLGGHTIAVWGDSGTAATLTGNPAVTVIADSDADTGGNITAYVWDVYHDPVQNPCRYGDGWYLPYNVGAHPYIIQWVDLAAADSLTDSVATQTVVDSYKVHQGDAEHSASDIHYKVGTDVDILSYRTEIDVTTNMPSIREEYVGAERRALSVDYSFDKPVPFSNWVTITTAFVVPTWNSIQYSDTYFTYPAAGAVLPAFKWTIDTPLQPNPMPNMTGGYVVGSFSLWSLDGIQLGVHRIQHEYDWNQNPESHTVTLECTGDKGCVIRDLKFGHSYGLLETDELWAFQTWFTEAAEERRLVPREPVVLDLNWTGRLPYPPAPGPGPWPGVTPRLSIRRIAGGNLEISWTGTGTLQEAPTVTGEWTATANQGNPQEVRPTAQRMFYRVKQ